MKKIFLIFIAALLFNSIWENLHSFLYENYRGGKITEFVLLRAALADAVMIAIITIPFIFFPILKKRSWIIFVVGFILAVGIEWWALGAGRWSYNEYMPIIPLFSVGFTPAIQLSLLGYFSFQTQEYILSRYFSFQKQH